MDNWIESIKNEFKQKTGMDLYEATEKYYNDILFTIKNDNEFKQYLEESKKETLEGIRELTNIILGATARDRYKDRIITDAVHYSIDHSDIDDRSKIDKYTIMSEEMFPQYKLTESMLEHSISCFNPLMYFSDYNGKVKCIFKPSKNFIKKYHFISPVYYGVSTKLKCYAVDLQVLRTYNHINISESDIVSINYQLYHPILRGWIANKDFVKFKLQ